MPEDMQGEPILLPTFPDPDDDTFEFSRDIKNLGNFEFIPVGDPPKKSPARDGDSAPPQDEIAKTDMAFTEDFGLFDFG